MLAVRVTLPDGGVAGPPVILVHGAASSARVWTFRQRSYAIDRRGHGDSDPGGLFLNRRVLATLVPAVVAWLPNATKRG